MFRKLLIIVFVLALFAALPGLTGFGAQRATAALELTMWHMEQPPHRVARVQTLLDEWNKANPDVQIKQEAQNWGEIYTKAPLSAKANTLPDILFGIPDFTTTLLGTDAVQPVTALVNELDAKHKFSKAGVEPYSYNGEIWAVPLYGMVHSLWYNKKMFAEAGLEAPKTWDELLAAAQKLHNPDKGVYGIGLPANKQLYTDQVLYNIMLTAGASELFNEDGSVAFDNPMTVKAFEAYKALWAFSPPDSVSWTWGEAEAALASGTVPMIFQFTVITTWDAQSGNAPEDLGVTAIPVAADGAPGAIFYSNAAMVTTKDAARKEAVGKFLSWLLEPANYGRFLNMEAGLFLPVTEDGAKADSFWNEPLAVKYRSQIETMVANTANGALFGFTKGRVFQAIGGISAQNLLSAALQQMVVEGKSPADAVKWGQDEMTKVVQGK